MQGSCRSGRERFASEHYAHTNSRRFEPASEAEKTGRRLYWTTKTLNNNFLVKIRDTVFLILTLLMRTTYYHRKVRATDSQLFDECRRSWGLWRIEFIRTKHVDRGHFCFFTVLLKSYCNFNFDFRNRRSTLNSDVRFSFSDLWKKKKNVGNILTANEWKWRVYPLKIEAILDLFHWKVCWPSLLHTV